MLHNLRVPFMALLLLLISTPVLAEVVRDLYSAEVEVPDQGATALASGASKALAVVLVKASGSDKVLQEPSIRAELKDARAHVQKYAYRKGRGGDQGLWARYEFEGAYITGLIRDSGALLWTANRPEVLVWGVIEAQGSRQFVSADGDPDAVASLSRAFSSRGLPLKLPVFDLNDTASLSPDQLWRLDSRALRDASIRYNVQHVVGVRVAQLGEDQFVGDWLYISEEDRRERRSTAQSLDELFRDGVALVADDMASRYAVAPVASDGQGVRMMVRGIRAYADYAGVVSSLEKLELIEAANVEYVADDVIVLRLFAQADAFQLAPLIELNRRLQPVPSSDPEMQLSYQWQ